MSESNPPSIDNWASDRAPGYFEWMHYCFEQGYADFSGDDGGDDVRGRHRRFTWFDPTALASYMIRLFETPSFLVTKYTADQIAGATWFLFGVASEYFHRIRHHTVPHELQIRCVRSVATCYMDLFDRICGDYGKSPDVEWPSTSRVDVAVHTIWDMDCIEPILQFPDTHPHLVGPALDVIDVALHRCRSAACRASALNAVWEVMTLHRDRKDQLIVNRLEQSVRRFRNANTLPEWLDEYAASLEGGRRGRR